jgi:hypothetical protein
MTTQRVKNLTSLFTISGETGWDTFPLFREIKIEENPFFLSLLKKEPNSK